MRTPITISLALLVIAALFSLWMAGQNLEDKNFLSLIISTVATTGALISAVFLIYGYLVNLSAFKESQKPRILLQVHNGRANLNSTGQNVHTTIITYSNVSTIECKRMELHAQLVNEKESIDIPRLFSCPMNLPPNDNRTRDFPTKVYLSDNGVDQAVIDNLGKYRLRVGYRYPIMGETAESYYEYTWDQDREWWGIA